MTEPMIKTEEILDSADDLLAQIAEADMILADIGRQKSEAVAQAAAPYESQEKKWTDDRAELVRDLERTMQDFEGRLFDCGADDDVVPLKHGVLRRAVVRRAKRVKKMVANLFHAHRHDLIRIEQKADWDRIDQLTDAELARIGTERVEKIEYGYDIKGAK